jgi:hypothetical protein
MDASQMLEQLMKWKDSDPLWIVKLRLDPVSRKLKSHLLYKENYITNTMMLQLLIPPTTQTDFK